MISYLRTSKMILIIQNLLVIFLLNTFIQTTHSQDVVTNDAAISNLYITVNARYNRLELTWRNFNDRNGYIVLTEDYPIQNFQRSGATNWEYTFGQTKKRAIYSTKPTQTNGWIETNVVYNRNVMNNVRLNTSCYGYYGYFVNSFGLIQSVYCMKLHPTWMNDRRAHLGKFRLRELFIPGTHDSSTYRPGLLPIFWNVAIHKYSVTQDDSIRDQLLQGVRYIDLRPAYYALLKPPFYANHGIIIFHQLKVILDQVRDFALKTKEIIILDAHEFPFGFVNNGIHDQLVKYLKDSLWDVMADPTVGWSAKLEDIWARNRTVILSYNNNYVAAKYPNLVWSPIAQRWGNVQSVEALKNYLYKQHQNPGTPSDYPLLADMAELTPTTAGVITGRSPGLREMADAVNRPVTQWYLEDLGPTTNVVAVDFVRGTSIVDVALYWNHRKVPRG